MNRYGLGDLSTYGRKLVDPSQIPQVTVPSTPVPGRVFTPPAFISPDPYVAPEKQASSPTLLYVGLGAAALVAAYLYYRS